MTTFLQSFREGLESKYPLCCILFFCIVWEPAQYHNWEGTWRGEYWSQLKKNNRGYITCPYHLRKA